MKRTNLGFFSAGLWLNVGILALANLTIEIDLSLAQSYRGTRRLPPPPSVRQPTRKVDDKARSICSTCGGTINPVVPSANRSPREYVFQAPASVRPATAVSDRRPVSPPRIPVTTTRSTPAPSAALNPPQPRRVISANQIFRVQVKGDSPEALTLIKSIEPLAFIRSGENVIQAGLFQQQQQAKQRVQELASLGFTAHIITLNGQRF